MATFDPTFDESALLAEIRRRESSNNYAARNAVSTASGAYQFINSTWRMATSATGVGMQYATAADAPPAVQDINALWLLRYAGPNSTVSWAASGPYGTSSTSITASNGGPIVDLSGEAAAKPTTSILDEIGTSVTQATGIEMTPEEAGIAVAVVVAAALYVAL